MFNFQGTPRCQAPFSLAPKGDSLINIARRYLFVNKFFPNFFDFSPFVEVPPHLVISAVSLYKLSIASRHFHGGRHKTAAVKNTAAVLCGAHPQRVFRTLVPLVVPPVVPPVVPLSVPPVVLPVVP